MRIFQPALPRCRQLRPVSRLIQTRSMSLLILAQVHYLNWNLQFKSNVNFWGEGKNGVPGEIHVLKHTPIASIHRGIFCKNDDRKMSATVHWKPFCKLDKLAAHQVFPQIVLYLQPWHTSFLGIWHAKMILTIFVNYFLKFLNHCECSSF